MATSSENILYKMAGNITASLQGTVSAAERSMRSVFVGNIPYEATEEQLKDIFSEVGPVVSFRLVYDRETGKPKGYGFCEYKDQETALSAMRNLNSFELNGRPLRVDNAASEKSKEELKNLQASMGGAPTSDVESPYGAEIEADHAPEAISKAVASLPPEQMFELMKQMKLCIQNNPNEARNMLLQNPQLAYALLQAQVIMRIVDPQVALGMLHRQNPNSAPLLAAPMDQEPLPGMGQGLLPTNSMADFSSYSDNFHAAIRPNIPTNNRPALLGDRPTIEPTPVNPIQPSMGIMNPPAPFGGMDNQNMGDRDMRNVSHGDRDLRGNMLGLNDRDMRDQDMRNMNQDFDPRFRGANATPLGNSGMGMMGGNMANNQFNQTRPSGGSFDPRGSGGFDRSGPMNPVRPEDPRSSRQAQNPPATTARNIASNIANNASATAAAALAAAAAPRPAGASITAQDQEKAALIMQVLALSDQQIAMLPAEQRQSILILKEQIARSAQN